MTSPERLSLTELDRRMALFDPFLPRAEVLAGLTALHEALDEVAVWRRVGQASFVYVVEQDRARRREVKLGLEQPQAIEVAAGLKPGEVVVAEQNLELADGASVTARP